MNRWCLDVFHELFNHHMILHRIICAIQQVSYVENGSYSKHGLYCGSSAWKYHTQESKFTPFRRAEN